VKEGFKFEEPEGEPPLIDNLFPKGRLMGQSKQSNPLDVNYLN